MDAFAIPLVVFTAFMVWLLVEVIRGSFEDPLPLRAGVTWAITCPLAGLLYGLGLTPLAVVAGAVSVLALGSLGHWFLSTEPDDSEDDDEAPVEPDPGPSDDVEILPAWALRPAVDHWEIVDWDAFDRARTEWEKERTPTPEPIPAPDRELLPAGL